jgi:hypothetical protein
MELDFSLAIEYNLKGLHRKKEKSKEVASQ